MLNHPHSSRTVYLGLMTKSPKWVSWAEERVARIESLIRGDICFDGYRLQLWREDTPSDHFPCSREFHWKLLIRST